MDTAYYSAIDMLRTMISTPSVSREETEVADFIEEAMRSHSLTAKRKGNNIWCMNDDFNPEKPTILLNSHIDTVRPVATWTKNPFSAEEDESGRIYGLGSNDAGASVVTLFQSFLLLNEKPQSYNLIFLASCQEEISGKDGIEMVIPELPPIAFAIVGEPTGMNPAIAEKGLLVIDGAVYGKSGHAARNEGVNAIYEALSVIEKVKNFDFPLKSDLLGNVKVTLTQINAGTQHNVVPDKCTFVLDIRTNECYSNQEAFNLLQQSLGCELKARSFRLNSSRISKDHPFVRRALMLGKESFGSPTLSDQALMTFDSVKIGPGDSARSHSADEYITKDEIREAIEIYVKLLDGLTL